MNSEPQQPSKSSPIGIVIVLAVGLFLAAVLILPVFQRSHPGHGRDGSCRNNLKQLGIALQNYHDMYKSFPPAFVVGEDGKPMHSWRVLLLPFLEEDPEHKKLYEQYDFNEPWNGPNNSKLADKMPTIFQCPSVGALSNNTNYLAVVGPATVWPGERGMTKGEITDGLPNTIMLVESKDSGVNWLDPRDIPLSEAMKGINQPKARHGITSNHEGGANFLFADGTAHFLSIKEVGPQLFHALLTAAGGEPVTPPE